MKIDQMRPWFDEEEAIAVYNYIKNGGWLTDFKKTRELEHMIADYTKSKYCCVVNNGTTALQIALMAMDIQQGDKVVVPVYSHPASAYAVSLVGADAVFCDIEKDTFNISFEKLWKVAKDCNPKCIMFVSINGRSWPIGEVCNIFKDKVLLLEDSCQSLGSKFGEKYLGTIGDIGVLSLNTFKIISAGQGGVLLTDNKYYYDRIVRIKDYGRAGGRGSDYEMLGMNAKYTDIQSVIVIEQMKKLDWRVEKKKKMFLWYMEYLNGIEQVRFIPTNLIDCAPWYIDPLVENRDGLIKYLAENEIEAQPFYPPLHTIPYYKKYRAYWGDLKNAEYISEHGIWLPSSSFLEKENIEFICSKIKDFYKK
ncbi:MAG: DegT/DnrJ/EryC1/StrS family aminotransferase [Lutibacter sp.]|jgi:perosamine synthetase